MKLVLSMQHNLCLLVLLTVYIDANFLQEIWQHLLQIFKEVIPFFIFIYLFFLLTRVIMLQKISEIHTKIYVEDIYYVLAIV